MEGRKKTEKAKMHHLVIKHNTKRRYQPYSFYVALHDTEFGTISYVGKNEFSPIARNGGAKEKQQ